MSGLRRQERGTALHGLKFIGKEWLYASQSGIGLLTVVKEGFFRNLFIDLIAFALQYAPNNGRVRVVHLRHFSGLHGFGSHFQIKYGSVPCRIFTGLFGFEYTFLDPWRPLPGCTTWLFCCVKGIALVTLKETELIQYGSAVGEIRASFNEF